MGCDSGVRVSECLWVEPEEVPGPSSITSRSGSSTGRSRRRTWSIRVKIAVLAPMPRARVSTTTRVKAGFFTNARRASRRSCSRSSIVILQGPRAVLGPDLE